MAIFEKPRKIVIAVLIDPNGVCIVLNKFFNYFLLCILGWVFFVCILGWDFSYLY